MGLGDVISSYVHNISIGGYILGVNEVMILAFLTY